MAPQEEANLGDLGLIPRSHVVEEENQFLKIVLSPFYPSAMAHTYTYRKINVIKCF